LSEVAVENLPAPSLALNFDDDEDLYGPFPQASSSRTPAVKKRKLAKETATPSSAKSKSSASSAVFTPVDNLDTPTTSVSSSIRKVDSILHAAKRKLIEIDSQSEKSVFDIIVISDEYEEDVQDGSFSIGPTAASDETFTQTVATINPLQPRQPHNFKRWRHRLSHWERTNMALCEHHPELACVWDELENTPPIKPVAVPQPEGLSLRLLPFQLEGLDWLLRQEQQARFGGGILADEMGMGKTIQTIALLLAEPRGKPNLVVAPTVALMQWKSEIETHTNNGLSVCLFYGANRSISAKQLKEYDVVLTTCTYSNFLSNV
jgi:DNA repair protein RAD16